MIDMLALTTSEFAILAMIAFVAGLVRGFSGFALSAIVVAAGATVVPPVALIPICWWLEMTASALMVRSGWREADKHTVFGLAGGSMIGVPIGLMFTTAVSPDVSKIAAVSVIVLLAIVQLAKVRMPFLATRAGLYGSGVTSGIVTGIAGVGGMIVALYVLALDTRASKMRAALVMYLFISATTSLVTFLLFGIMDPAAASRGIALIIPTAAGVIAGKRLFNAKLEPYYKPFCLCLLVALGIASLTRLAL